MLRIQTIGTLDVTADGGSLASVLAQPKRAAVLLYLALARPRGFHRRDTLLPLFWPELDERHARNALSQSLTFLRRTVGERLLITRGSDEVGLAFDHVQCDVHEFEAALERQDWTQALALYRGPLLHGFHAAGSEFEDWLEAERQRLVDAAAQAGWSLAHDRLAAGRPQEAERLAERALRLVPTNEGHVRAFIQALAESGERPGALRFYDTFAGLLQRELDVQPAADTQALRAAVRSGEVPVRVVSATFTERRPGERADGDDSVRSGGPAGAASQPRVRPARGVRGVVTAGVVALLLLMLAMLFEDSPPRAEAPTVLMVADLASTDTVLGVAAGAWLRSLLDASRGISVPHGPALVGALARMRRDPMLPLDSAVAGELAIREGALALVTGEITRTGTGFHVNVRLVGTGTAERLDEFAARAAGPGALPAALEEIRRDLLKSLGVPLPRQDPLERVTTASLEALLAYTHGNRLRYHAQDDRAAIPHYERAIAFDSTFAMAYSALGGAWNALGGGPSVDTIGRLWRKAVQYGEGLPPRERLAVEDRLIFLSPDSLGTMFDRAVRLYQDYVRLHPDDGFAHQQLSWYLKHTGRWLESEAPALHALRLGHDIPGLMDELVLAQIAARKFAAADSSLRTWRERYGTSSLWYRDAFRLAAARRDYAAADSLFRQSARDGFPLNPRLQIFTLAIRGRLREAGELHRQGHAGFVANNQGGAILRQTAWLAAIRANATGDTADARALLQAALTAYPVRSLPPTALRGVHYDLGPLLPLLGDTAGARALLETMPDNLWIYRVDHLMRGLLHAAAGRPHDAVRELRQVRYTAGHLPWLAQAYVQTGLPDSAIAVYERFLTHIDPNYPAWDAVFLADVLERAGALHTQRGNHERAAECYRMLLALWSDADPELDGRVARARRLAAEAAARDVPPGPPAAGLNRSAGIDR